MELHDYQQYAVRFLETHPVAALLIQMGLGKTIITLTALQSLLFDSFEAHKVLVIAPLRVARVTWPDEIEKWQLDLEYSVIAGTPNQRQVALARKADLYIINRENVPWLCQQPFAFDTVVIDELSSFKNHQAQRFKALMKKRPQIKRMIGLTGTPSSNGLEDIWAEFRLLDMGERLGRSITRFRQKYLEPDRRNGMTIFSYKPLPGSEDKIYELISDITISMKSIDHLRMPDLFLIDQEVQLDDKEQELYKSLKADLVLSLDDQQITAANAASLSSKLLQLSSGAIYTEDGSTIPVHDKKLEALEELVEQAQGKPVLVAYWFRHELERLKQRFVIRELKSAADIQDWNAGKISLAAIHPASAGHGLNLQAGGSMLVWMTLPWSLELYQQTNARLYRQGQKEAVRIFHLVTRNTIDGQVLSALKKKDISQNRLIDAVRAEVKR